MNESQYKQQNDKQSYKINCQSKPKDDNENAAVRSCPFEPCITLSHSTF
jgi:hypothetical protein